MANRIFTNGEEGKILTSVGNRIIKQPYEFGNAFQNRMGLNNYIKVSNINVDLLQMSWLYWFNSIAGNQNIFSFMNSTDSYSYYSYSSNVATSFTRNGALSSNINLITTKQGGVPASAKLFAHISNGVSGNLIMNNDNAYNLVQNTGLVLGNSTSIILGGYGVNQAISANTVAISNRFVLYSRIINISEYVFFYSNKLGNELQSTSGIEIDLHNDKAEILDFSTLQDGSDMRVGCRDYSGFNRHGEIMNLPAGTLQQKCDYANANLFVPFLT